MGLRWKRREPEEGLVGSIPALSVMYFTDGKHLFELVSQRTVQNYGLRGGTISYTILRDVVTEKTYYADDMRMLFLSEVK
jgi:hypothetical protein